MTKTPADEKTRKAINNQFFKRLNFVAKELHEMELLELTIKQREPNFVDLLIVICQAETVVWSCIFVFFSISFATSRNMKNSNWIESS